MLDALFALHPIPMYVCVINSGFMTVYGSNVGRRWGPAVPYCDHGPGLCHALAGSCTLLLVQEGQHSLTRTPTCRVQTTILCPTAVTLSVRAAQGTLM